MKKSLTKSGITSLVSGKYFAKKFTNLASSFSSAKEFSPSKGMNRVQVKVPSKLDNAINIKFPRGQICNEFLSILWVPSAFAGMCNSL